MGRAKKTKWWHQRQQVPPVQAGRYLQPGDIIAKGDHFESVGSLYPVSSTVGTPWHDKLPPMWRGPHPKLGQSTPEPEQVVISTRHQEFLDLLEMAGFALPNQFQNWRRFFLDEKNFLTEAEHWLSLKLQKRFPRIEDDVDKGLMTRGAAPASSPRPYQSSSEDEYEDYWTSWQGWHKPSYGYIGKWQSHQLPLTPKIPAPSGTCGAALMVM